MRDRFIVGVDGTSQGNDAVALAARLAGGTGAALTLAYIYNKEPTAEDQDRHYRREVKDRAVSILKPTLERLPEEIHAESGAYPSNTTAHGLRDVARGQGADLIVLGSTHYGPVGRVLIGSVGELLCSDAPCAVAVSPRGLADNRQVSLARIGVAFDGSDESGVALVQAVGIADSFDADLAAFTVLKGGRFSLHSRTRKADATAKAQLSKVLEKLAPQRRVEHVVTRGDTIKRLTEAAQELDLLVVGSRRLGPIRHALLGGVSGKLMRAVSCPLLVVPGPQQPAGKTGNAPAGRSRG